MAKILEEAKKVGSWADRVKTWAEWISILGVIFISIIGPQRYNHIRNEINSVAITIRSEAEAKFQQGKISKKDLEKIKSTAENNDIQHYLKDGYDSIRNYNFSGALTALSDFGHTLIHPEKVGDRVNAIKDDYIQTLDERNKQLSDINTALNSLDGTNCSDSSLQHYKSALEALTALELPTKDYEAQFDRINTKCEEIEYFDNLSEKMIQLVPTLKEKGFDTNGIANHLGMYFASHVRPVEEMKDIESRTRNLDERLSKELGGYGLGLPNYLTTSKK